MRRVVLSSASLLALGLVAVYEGKELVSYLDPVGVPTACSGHTHGVELGQIYTEEECTKLLEQDIRTAERAVTRHVTLPIKDTTKAALISFTFNVGEGNLARSTLLKKLNRGDIRGACNELPRWVYAGGKRLRGLVKRREAEKKLCLQF